MSEQYFPPLTYTQAPNEFFDRLLGEIDSLGELKVTLIIIRETFGWQRTTAELSLSDLQKLTGLTRVSVCAGIEKALERGYVYRRQEGQSFLYGLRVAADSTSKESIPAEKSGSKTSIPEASKESIPLTSKESIPAYKDKESSKKTGKKGPPHTHGPALPAGARDASDIPKRVCVDDSKPPNLQTPQSPKSKFSLEDRQRYARNHHELRNPNGWLASSEDGRYDTLVGQWLSLHGPPVEGVPPAAARDVSKCPDCHGSGMYYPNGFEKGAAKCRHPRLSEKGSVAA